MQNGLRVRKYRFIKLKAIGRRMKIRRGVVAEFVEIELKVIVGAKTTQRLVWRTCNDRARGGSGILHRHWGHALTGPDILTGARRIVDDCPARAVGYEAEVADAAREMDHRSVDAVGDGQRVGGRVELLAEARREAIDVCEIDLVGVGLRSIGRAETGNHAIEAFGVVELQHSCCAAKDHRLA